MRASQAPASLETFTGPIRVRVQPGSGEGRVLWIHGYTVDSSIWSPIWERLPQWSHFGIDLPGHGASDALPPELSSLPALGDQLAATAERLGIQHVVGLSVGTILAAQIAISRPGAFSSLTLAAPALAGGPVDQDVGQRYRELIALYRRRGRGPWMTELWMRCPPDTFAHAGAELRAELAAMIDRHRWEELANPQSGLPGLTRQVQDASAIAKSTARHLYIIGEYELPAFLQTAAILRAVNPRASLVRLAGAGHLCILQAPAEAARLLASHWRQSLTPQPSVP
jgi:2-succinyl-6-hydroxy-2,4-cyclohexadiene-1-carboxylate synthase